MRSAPRGDAGRGRDHDSAGVDLAGADLADAALERMEADPYQGYVYAYPHKSAYRPLEPALPLDRVWAEEPRGALFLYLHVPFCEQRCGFCNLFTRVGGGDLLEAYLASLERQLEVSREALPGARFSRLALGGGTPSFLRPDELARVLDALGAQLAAKPAEIPTSVELSPGTATRDRLDLLLDRGVERLSMGVQTFEPRERVALGRPEQLATTEAALEALEARRPRILNLDLIYGIPGQDPASWDRSLERVLAHRPEELYLYPLYVRPLTGMGRRGAAADSRPQLYALGRDRLRAAGYRQVSKRFFRLDSLPEMAGPGYCCQEDGMLGLGPGARSYTRALHYSSDYAVSQRGVAAVLEDWVERSREDHARVEYGVRLDLDEQRRRHLLKSLLRIEGLDIERYLERFGAEPHAHFPWLERLEARGWLQREPGRWWPTEQGLALSDALGPALFSPAVRGAMDGFVLR